MNTSRINLMLGMALLIFSICAAGEVPNRSQTASNPESLQRLFSSYWEDYLRDNPEAATVLGDRRYNDRWSDLSPRAIQNSLRRNREYERRLKAVNTGSLSAQDKLSVAVLLRELGDERESIRFKEWEMPLNQIHGIHFELPQLVSSTPFEDARDYENYIGRLRKVPILFEQLQLDMSLGIKDGHVPARLISEKVLAQMDVILAIKAEDSPFLKPIKTFPGTIRPEDQNRFAREIRAAFSHGVIPAYQALAKFLETQYIPRSRTKVGVWSIPDGDAYTMRSAFGKIPH